jgi:hypothetical protein
MRLSLFSSPVLRVAFALALSLSLGGTSGCEGDAAVELDAAPDARVQLVDVDLERATPATVEYLRRVSMAHAEADALLEDDRAGALDHLRIAWELTPSDEGIGRVTHLELSARMAEIMLLDEGGAVDAVALLRPMLAAEIALPKDRSSARALVALGDAAAGIDDDALAAGSYARAVRVMSALRKEMSK